MKKIFLMTVLAALAGCSPKEPADDSAPKAGSSEPQKSTMTVTDEAFYAPNKPPQTPHGAAETYLKGTVGQIDKAKAAKKLFEETEAERMKLPEDE